MSFKILHSFTVSLDQEVKETTKREENGQTIEITSTVKKAVPYTIVLKEPTRREQQDLSLFQAVTYNDAIAKGLLPKVIMQQKIMREGTNNPLSGDEDKNLATMNVRLQELANDFIRLNALSNPSSEQKDQRDKTLLEFTSLQKKTEDMNTAYQSVFAYTAESYTQNKTLSWLTLFLTHLKKGDNQYEPLFPGDDFKKREEASSDKIDANDPLYLAAIPKLSIYWMLYLMRRASTPEEFGKVEAEWAKMLEAEKQMKEKQAAEEAAQAKMAENPVPTVSAVEPPAQASQGTE